MPLFKYLNRGRLWRVYARSVLRYSTPRKLINAARTEWAYRRRHADKDVRPYVMFIEPLYYCNLKCPLCPRVTSADARPNEKMPLELIDRVFDELGDYLYQCHIFGNGEPMLDWKRTQHVIQAAHRKRVFTLISTNCTIMNPKTADEVVTSGLDYLACAIDGITNESYTKYRVGTTFEKAFAGMRELCDARERTGSKMDIEWQFLVNAYNHHEMDDARRMADDLGVFLRFAPMLGDPEWLPPKDVLDRMNWGTSPSRRDFACYWLWRAIVINSNGLLGRCPGYSNIAQYGDVADGPILPVYNGAATQMARRLFTRGGPEEQGYPKPCVSCDNFCRHHGAGFDDAGGGGGHRSRTIPLPVAARAAD